MNTLLKVKGELSPVCSKKTHITYSFYIPEGVTELHAHFAYSPKVLEDAEKSKELVLESLAAYVEPHLLPVYRDKWESYLPLNNLITLSLDDPQGFRGSGHRHNPDQRYILSEQEASPGLERGPVISGMWKITLSVHCIVTETCDYELQVWEGEGTL